MTRGGKYANKTPFKKFLHKNTGFIVMAIFIAIAVPVWLVYEDSRYFFDDWTCETILKMDHTEIIGDEHLAFHVIYQDCAEIEEFAP